MENLIISIVTNTIITVSLINLLTKKHLDQVDEEFKLNYEKIYEDVIRIIIDKQKQTNNRK